MELDYEPSDEQKLMVALLDEIADTTPTYRELQRRKLNKRRLVDIVQEATGMRLWTYLCSLRAQELIDLNREKRFYTRGWSTMSPYKE